MFMFKPNPVSLSDYIFLCATKSAHTKIIDNHKLRLSFQNAIVITTMMVKPTPIFFQMKSSHKPYLQLVLPKLCIFHRKLMLLMTCHCQHVSTTTWDFFDHENKSPKDSKIQTKMHTCTNEYMQIHAKYQKEQKNGKNKVKFMFVWLFFFISSVTENVHVEQKHSCQVWVWVFFAFLLCSSTMLAINLGNSNGLLLCLAGKHVFLFEDSQSQISSQCRRLYKTLFALLYYS